MSRENVELVRRCVSARDRGSYAAVAPLIHPEVVVDLSVRPDGRVYRGRVEAAEALRSWVDRWEAYSYEGEIVGATVWTVADDKVVHTKTYTDRREALEAVGLSAALSEE